MKSLIVIALAAVTAIATLGADTADAKRLGAHEVVVSKDEAQMAAHAGSFDFILDCVSAQHDLNAYPDFQQTTIKSYHLREA